MPLILTLFVADAASIPHMTSFQTIGVCICESSFLADVLDGVDFFSVSVCVPFSFNSRNGQLYRTGTADGGFSDYLGISFGMCPWYPGISFQESSTGVRNLPSLVSLLLARTFRS